MTTLDDLYVHYCRRCGCKANSQLRSQLGDAYAAAGETRTLNVVDVSQNYVGPKGFQPVMMLVANLDSVERLDASNNMLTHESLEALAEVAARHAGLREIYISNNDFHDASAHVLLHLLKTNWRLTDLRVDGNDLTPHTMAKIETQLQANRAAVTKAAADDEMLTADARAVVLEREKARYTPWEASVDCAVEDLHSGGSLHFASWRENPQYHLYTSHAAPLTITMSVHDASPMRLCGFVVLRGRNPRRVVDIATDPSVIIAESSFGDTGATVTLELPAAPRGSLAPYVVIPLTFQPRKGFRCTLKASIPSHMDGALVKLEPLEPRGDWFVNHLDGEWHAESAGGSLTNPSWRRNPMFRLEYTGKPTVGKASLTFVVSKANDDDDNDDRAVGIYLLAPDAKGRRPIRAGAAHPNSVIAGLDHRRAATQIFNFETTCDAKGLDFFVMPTTEHPHQTGAFSVTLYSTCKLDVYPSPYGQGWFTQRIRAGVWDASRSGGCRAENPTTWPHNPCYQIDVGGDQPVDLHLQLEAKLEGGAPEAAQAGGARRGGTLVDVGVLLVRADDDLTPVSQSQWVPASACTWGDLWVDQLEPGLYYALPVTRLAGLLGTYEMELAASRAVHVSLETPLNVRLRQRQLQRYEDDTRARKEEQRAQYELLENVAAPTTPGAAPGAAGADGVPSDLAAAAEIRSAAMTSYHQSGARFIDRDFPRGPSSLWKNAMEQPVIGDHPNVHAWRRPDEISGNPCMPRADDELGCVPQGYDTAWVHSALAAVTTRPAWLKNLIVAAQPEYGLYQVRFFKAGEWRTITVDDHLPVDAAGEVCFARPLDAESVMAPVVEKAYAKLHRCYEALDATTSALQQYEIDARDSVDETSVSCDAGYSLVSRALSDFTGGVVFERRLYDQEGKAFCFKGLWSLLQTSRDETRVVAMRLTRATPRSSEKKEHGILLDRLYPVVDTREVEGVKLVKLRNFWGWGTQDAGASKEWKGKWRPSSDLWTPTLRKAVSLDENDRTTFWMSVEEAIFYFGVVHTCDCALRRAWAHGGFACNAPGGDLSSESWPRNPQYALHVATDAPCDVIVGLHQPDALLTLNRDDTGRADYRATLGVVTTRTTDDKRKLLAITDKELPENGPTGERRDLYYRVRYDPTQSYIVMPFNATPLRECNYSISVSAACDVAISQIGSDLSVSVDGEWSAESAGGPPTAVSWRNNPQYLIYATEETTATIVLRQRNDICSTTDAIGFTVIAARDVRRAMSHAECDVVCEVPHDNAKAVTANVRLRATKDRLGMPYLIVPSTARGNCITGFTLEVVCNARVTVKPIDEDIDYRRKVITGTMSFDNGNAGGSIAHSSWRCNPQFAITFPVAKTGKLVVSMSKRLPSDVQEIGVYALRADPWDHGRRRKVHLAQPTKDVLAAAALTSTSAVDISVDFAQQREPILLMPCTAIPFSDCEYQLSIYCTCDFTITPVDEWHQHDVLGSWEMGITAGGSKERHASWINNPFFGLNVTRPTRVTLIAVQYPRGPEKQVVRRVGRSRVLVPPPIVNDRSKVCFGFDLCTSNGDTNAKRRYDVLAASKHTFEAELAMTTKLEACETEPYYVVPHTYDAEQEADFRVFVYADQPVQFDAVEKARLTYV